MYKKSIFTNKNGVFVGEMMFLGNGDSSKFRMCQRVLKVSGEFSSQKFGVFLESFPKTIWFYLESGVRRGSPKMYGESKGL